MKPTYRWLENVLGLGLDRGWDGAADEDPGLRKDSLVKEQLGCARRHCSLGLAAARRCNREPIAWRVLRGEPPAGAAEEERGCASRV